MTRRGRIVPAAVILVAAVVAVALPSPVSASPAPDDSVAAVAVSAAPPDAIETAAAEIVSGWSIRERAAAVVMGHVPVTDPDALRAYMQSSGIGGFILMGANIPGDEAQLQLVTDALVVDASLPPLIAIDQEGGDVSRLPWDGFASSVTLKDLPPDQTRTAFAGRGALVQRAGVSVNFGVVADITADQSMFIYRRALGTGPDSGAAHVAAAVEGEAPFAASTLKHFPGHGAAPGDSHAGIPQTDMPLEQWSATDAAPFVAGIDAGAPLLMFGHLAYTSVDDAPASLSARWHEIARDELGFTGVSITDDLGMLQASGIAAYDDPVANAVAAVAAGNDMVLAVMFSSAETATDMAEGIAAAVEDGTLPAARLDEAATRVVALRLSLAVDRMLPCAECVPVD